MMGVDDNSFGKWPLSQSPLRFRRVHCGLGSLVVRPLLRRSTCSAPRWWNRATGPALGQTTELFDEEAPGLGVGSVELVGSVGHQPFSGLRVFDGYLCLCVWIFYIATRQLNLHYTEHAHASEKKQQRFLVTYSCGVYNISSQAPMEHYFMPSDKRPDQYSYCVRQISFPAPMRHNFIPSDKTVPSARVQQSSAHCLPWKTQIQRDTYLSQCSCSSFQFW